jgi:glycosyltransferase involved in cell wall biosynthesis
MSNISCILYPPTLDFDYLVQRPQQIMKGFSQLGTPAYYINWPGPNMKRSKGIEQVSPNLFLFNNVDPAPYLSQINPVVYYTSAAHSDMVKNYKPSLIVFDSVDEPSGEFEGWKPYYDHAVRTADVVLATSQKLFNMAKMLNVNTYLIPNGCDFEFFSQASPRNLPIPQEMQDIKRPIIGYIGVLATWCDFELIDQMAMNFPNYSFVMIGPKYNISDLPQRTNLHWLGFRHYTELVYYAQMFDVGIIPFKMSSMVEAVNPIKMWEYMAVGMPVVTTALPEAKQFEGLIYYSNDYNEFFSNITRALADDSPERRQQRMELARSNSWRERAQQIINIIQSHLAAKGIEKAGPLPDIKSLKDNSPKSHGSYRINLAPSRQLIISRGTSYKFRVGSKPAIVFGKKPRSTQVIQRGVLSIKNRIAFRFQTARFRRSA